MAAQEEVVKCPHQGHHRRRREVLVGHEDAAGSQNKLGRDKTTLSGLAQMHDVISAVRVLFRHFSSFYSAPIYYTVLFIFSPSLQVCDAAFCKEGFTANLMIGLLAREAPGPLLQHEAPKVALQETGSCKNRKQYKLASVYMTGQ
jgi:hypothetical protein